MSKLRRVYIAATNQHIGKTTTTLGIISSLRTLGYSVGYCKPVGQKYIDREGVRADKDAFLFSQYMGFDVKPVLHSPVILGSGATTSYLDQENPIDYSAKILNAAAELESNYDIVVYEGTGHPGVGSVVDVSNAEVANILDAGVLMIVEAGIGKTIDLLTLNMALFEQHGVPILGVIINKTHRGKIDKVSHYVTKKLASKGIPVLGTIPYEEELAYPLMSMIIQAISGSILFHAHKMHNRIRDILAGSLIDKHQLKETQDLLLIVSDRRLDDALSRLQDLCKQECISGTPLGGILITGDAKISEFASDYINEHQIPVVASPVDTYESVIKISKIEVKINNETPWKINKAVSLFQECVDLSPLFQTLPLITP